MAVCLFLLLGWKVEFKLLRDEGRKGIKGNESLLCVLV
jgi:hypothetical protein